jgi:GNAT superfamily N-acetyltransferase
MMTTIRAYRNGDAASVGRLIARTYSAFNLGFAPPEQQAGLLGPFGFADSAERAHRAAIAEAIGAPIVLVAEEAGGIVGVLRGGRVDGRGRTVLQSLFVAADHQRRGIGRRLVERFEKACPAGGVTVIKVASTLYAVPFYRALGYRRSTGVRTGRSFRGSGLPYQPMRKTIA